MPGSGKYTQYQADDVTSGKKLVLSNQTLLAKAFASRPDEQSVVAGVAAAKIVNDGQTLLLPAVQSGDTLWWKSGQVNLQYEGNDVTNMPPDFKDVKVGGAGLPSTAWTPNIASPGEGNGADPSKQPDLGIGNANAAQLNSHAQQGVGGLLNPKDDSAIIGTNNGAGVISKSSGNIPLGGHPGGTGPQFD